MSDYLLRKSIRPLPGKVIKAVPIPEPKITSGFGARSEAGAICRERGFERALLVTDTTLNSLGYDAKVAESLKDAGVEYRLFAEISSEPTCEVIEAGRKAALEFEADCIIGLGGGSVMDSCKIISAGVRFRKLPISHLLLKFLIIPEKTLPIINIPSTAGTGAEMTVGAIITDTDKQRKRSTVIAGLDVTDVILDSELTVKMPRKVTAACGIDALSHGIEGAVAAVNTSDEDRWKSLECVRMVLKNLPKVLANPDDIDARQEMCLAANYGGNAINRQLAGYVHAFAHSIGAKYHIPHGNAIAMCLIPVLEAEMPHCIGKMALAARHCGVTGEGDLQYAADKLMEAFASLMETCDLPAQPSIPEEDFDELTKMIDADSINYSSPVTFTDEEIKEILKKIK
jgi:Alcohol dehydrogenase, class IV